MQLQLNVNGAERLLELDDPQTPLVFVLRDWLGLLGTKFSCLEGICGACTVHVDGVAARACQLPAGQMTGKRITTIEALSADGSHPVQRAWIAHQVPQCGWCQSGQIMQAAAFLAQALSPSRGEVVQAMAGNLCRCGSGPRVVDAVVAAAAQAR